MFRILPFRALLIAGLLGAFGCTSKPPIVPTGTVAVTLTPAEPFASEKAAFHSLLVVTLPPAPPDHRWQIAFHDTRFLQQRTPLEAAANASTGATVSFLVVNRGRTRLRFLLVPDDNRRSVDPIGQQNLVLTIE